jgi:hypothetical protein
MVDFSERGEVERWLDAIKPAQRRREVAVALAARAALRVLPLLGRELARDGRKRDEILSALVLPCLRATALPWVAGKYPTQGSDLLAYARAAAFAAQDARATDAAAADAAYAAARAAGAITNTETRDAIDVATDAIASAVSATDKAAATVAHTAVNATADALAADGVQVAAGRSGGEIAGMPLWPAGAPVWVIGNWHALKSALLAADQNWLVWTDWYEARFAGDAADPPNEALEIARATIPDEIWKRGLAAVKAEIKRLIEQFAPLRDAPSQRLDEGAIEIRSANGLMAWIDEQDASAQRDFAMIIAVRAALRALPTLSALFAESGFTNPSSIVLSSLRASILPWASIRFPTSKRNLAAADAALDGAALFATARDESGLRSVPGVAAAHAAADAYVFSLRASGRAGSWAGATYRSFIASVSRATDQAVVAYLPSGINLGQASWAAVSADVNALASGRSALELSQDRLWPNEGAPIEASRHWATLMTILKDTNQDWDVWFNWYQRRIEGPAMRASDNIERVYVEVPLPLWDEGPARVNRWIRNRIAEIAAPSSRPDGWDFFVSYANEDESFAREIVDVLEEAGHSTVAQFKDFPVGANFVNEMNRGLAETGRFVALYSPDYQASEHCQAEWAAAYNADPSGARRKLVAFLLQPTALTPLARQIVHRSLVGLSEDQRKAAVLDAIAPARTQSRNEIKERLAEVASPQASINAKEQLDAGPNATFDRPFVDADLPELPSIQRGLADTIRKSLPRNTPPVVGAALESYADHLLERGTQPIVRYLDDLAAAVRAEHDAPEAVDWGKGLATLFQRFFANDALLRTHFPLRGEEVFAELPIDEDMATGDALTEPINNVAAALQEVVAADKATPAIEKAVSNSAAFARDLASLPPAQEPPDPAAKRVTVKRRYVLGTIGFLATIYTLIGTTASIYGIPQGAALFQAVGEAIEKLMSLLL